MPKETSTTIVSTKDQSQESPATVTTGDQQEQDQKPPAGGPPDTILDEDEEYEVWLRRQPKPDPLPTCQACGQDAIGMTRTVNGRPQHVQCPPRFIRNAEEPQAAAPEQPEAPPPPPMGPPLE